MKMFDEAWAELQADLTGHVIAMPGRKPVGKVVRVDQRGAWLEGGGRIAVEGLAFYRPVSPQASVKADTSRGGEAIRRDAA